MRRKIGVLTSNDFLYQKIYLALRDNAELCAIRGAAGADYLLCDEAERSENGVPAFTMSKSADADLTIPFCEEDLLALFADKSSAVELKLGEKMAYLHDREIKLTEVEFSLLSLLYHRRDYVAREELIRSVWGEGADGGVLNVYIHYLREKLEFAGEKIIISSRKYGYKIDEKYLGEGGIGDA